MRLPGAFAARLRAWQSSGPPPVHCRREDRQNHSRSPVPQIVYSHSRMAYMVPSHISSHTTSEVAGLPKGKVAFMFRCKTRNTLGHLRSEEHTSELQSRFD